MVGIETPSSVPKALLSKSVLEAARFSSWNPIRETPASALRYVLAADGHKQTQVPRPDNTRWNHPVTQSRRGRCRVLF